MKIIKDIILIPITLLLLTLFILLLITMFLASIIEFWFKKWVDDMNRIVNELTLIFSKI